MLRDLLCHHSGSPRHDWIWLPGDLSPAQMLAAMRYLEPSDDIRTTFQYSNLGYLVASMVAERVSGQRWAEFTRALTNKLHMEVTFAVEELAAAADAAVPYAMKEDTRLRSKLWPVSVTAAGGMSTSIGSVIHAHNRVGQHDDDIGPAMGAPSFLTMLSGLPRSDRGRPSSAPAPQPLKRERR